MNDDAEVNEETTDWKDLQSTVIKVVIGVVIALGAKAVEIISNFNYLPV